MIKRINYYFLILSLLLITSCSFDKKTGIWDGLKQDRKKIDDLRKDRKRISNTVSVFSSSSFTSEEIPPKKSIILSKPKKNNSWQMSGLNLQNNIGHNYISGFSNRFLKKKISKNRFLRSEEMAPLLISNNYIYITNDSGTIFKVDFDGSVIWKKNIYKKLYKKLFKKLSFAIYKDNLFVSDNMGFIYSLDLNSGEPVWIKNHGIPLKSQLKIFNDKIFVVNQDNRLLSFSVENGIKFWDIRSISSYIKSQSILSISISNSGDLIFLNSSGDLNRVNADTGNLIWTLNAKDLSFSHDADFFESSNIVIDEKSIYFSTSTSVYSYDLLSGYLNWSKNVNSKSDPIIDGNYVFLVTKDGYFLNLDKVTGNVIWSTNILPSLNEGWKIPFEKEKSETIVTGFILGSGKLYITTFNGFMIICSASTGKVESFKRVAFTNTYAPVISNESLFILTKTFRLFGFN